MAGRLAKPRPGGHRREGQQAAVVVRRATRGSGVGQAPLSGLPCSATSWKRSRSTVTTGVPAGPRARPRSGAFGRSHRRGRCWTAASGPGRPSCSSRTSSWCVVTRSRTSGHPAVVRHRDAGTHTVDADRADPSPTRRRSPPAPRARRAGPAPARRPGHRPLRHRPAGLTAGPADLADRGERAPSVTTSSRSSGSATPPKRSEPGGVRGEHDIEVAPPTNRHVGAGDRHMSR